MGSLCPVQQDIKKKRKLQKREDRMESTQSKRKLSEGAEELLQKYEVLELIGTGSFGKVLYGRSRYNSDMKVAIKCIPKKKLKSKLNLVREEIAILRTLDHPNIVKYHDFYETSKNFFIVTEFCAGGELFAKIAQLGDDVFTEQEAARLLEKLLLGINHCHAHHIVHRDLKPQNILYSNHDRNSEIKIIDFGLSRSTLQAAEDDEIPEELALQSVVGTPYYVAPEVLKSSINYGAKCDLWSIGVILYIILSGYIPFTGKNAAEVFLRIRYGKYVMNQPEWNVVSPAAKDLVRALLKVDPEKRLSAAQALQHPWLVKMRGGLPYVSLKPRLKNQSGPLDPGILNTMRQFAGSSVLKKEASRFLVKMLKDEDIQHLKIRFHSMDKDNTGLISFEELKEAMHESGFSVPQEQITHLLEEINLKQNGLINYTEFIAATMKIRRHLNRAKLRALFRHFDVDDSGFITRENLKEVFERAGKELSEKQLDEVLKENDLTGDGRIGFHEFKAMMLGVELEKFPQQAEFI